LINYSIISAALLNNLHFCLINSIMYAVIVE